MDVLLAQRVYDGRVVEEGHQQGAVRESARARAARDSGNRSSQLGRGLADQATGGLGQRLVGVDERGRPGRDALLGFAAGGTGVG